ncbi:SOS response-associated peptidase family protein (plasmid) [Coraliomargarita sp. W4R53]
MCASYGLDPRFSDPDALLAEDAELIGDLRTWARENAGGSILPTGKNLRNLNPVLSSHDCRRVLSLGWWGYLVAGAPAKFPSINTRAERLLASTSASPRRAIVPATSWFELNKPQRQWFEFAGQQQQLLGLAALTQLGRTTDGTEYTCYSLVMRPATPALEEIHDRMPLLISAEFTQEWLNSDEPLRDVVAEALTESEAILGAIKPQAIEARPGAGRVAASGATKSSAGNDSESLKLF